jgi:predicted DNA-binding transcriptional regulator AlpA
MVDADDLVTAALIANRLGVKRPQVVHEWRRRHADFPPPLRDLGGVLVWVWPEVERWARATGRLRR